LTGIATGGLDVPTISLMVTIIGAILTAGFFIIRLEVRVKHLEEHPFIAGLKDLNKQDAIDLYHKTRAQKGGEQQ
jgi:hypothetical protein